jgi:hypothetical protein
MAVSTLFGCPAPPVDVLDGRRIYAFPPMVNRGRKLRVMEWKDRREREEERTRRGSDHAVKRRQLRKNVGQ